MGTVLPGGTAREHGTTRASPEEQRVDRPRQGHPANVTLTTKDAHPDLLGIYLDDHLS
ncbi:MAG TPA: hypothetical protein VGJ95_11265 [Pseudonocardiaceae bacterium]|jgi:hypothetical protein